ncbi:YfhO family protein [Ichthyobacterium seriolicida]|uniref:Bacterial membrane protein YfhO n=1 Tax=Ichthyobacterium seriolicida TaxID=242600 RepID=A0A1J1DYG4_9FLAO|nr:YfhO family protein [Ichthyobacterium seriolicida]BAV94913.1 hypothetical protein JBKA6_0900 [Ichthyobacterium seriolicida]
MKRYLPHLIVISIFYVISLGYFSPDILQDRQISPPDMLAWEGMAKEYNDFHKKTGKQTGWSNSMFGGMPTYQFGGVSNYDLISYMGIKFVMKNSIIPYPASIIFMYFLCFYILLLCLNFNYKTALLGALSYGLSSYLLIIIDAGHISKALAIAYIPLVVAGTCCVFDKKYIKGFLLLSIGGGLQINSNHYQMTYYMIMSLSILVLTSFINSYKNRELKCFAKSSLTIFLAGIIAIGINIQQLWTTYSYSKQTIRGTSELTLKDSKNSKVKSGLDKDYITDWSYGKMETFNLLIPNLMGGSSISALPEKGAVYQKLKRHIPEEGLTEIINNSPAYWGPQPGTSGPAYLGVVVLFLFILSLFLYKGKLKNWLIASILLSLFLSWGKNMMWLTNLFIDYFPFYNKFRAVSSIQIIIEFAVPFMAMLGLREFLSKKTKLENKKRALSLSTFVLLIIPLFFYLFGSDIFPFEKAGDTRYGFPLEALREDRLTMLKDDSMRACLFAVTIFIVLYIFLKNKLKENYLIAILTVLVLLDLVSVNKRYLNSEDFIDKKDALNTFIPNRANLEILKDKGVYRVFNTSNTMNESRTSYFHHSIGGYHAAKLMRYQQLWDHHISKKNTEVINMLNAKYFILHQRSNGKPYVLKNRQANGNVWFVDKYKIVDNPDEEINSLSSIKTKEEAVIDKRFAPLLRDIKSQKDSTETISLIDYQPNNLVYEYSSKDDRLAIFSEIFYQDGWNAYINNVKTPHFRANFVLRAMMLPKGNNRIEFKFEPKQIYIGTGISLLSYSIIFIIIGFLVYRSISNRKNKILISNQST